MNAVGHDYGMVRRRYGDSANWSAIIFQFTAQIKLILVSVRISFV